MADLQDRTRERLRNERELLSLRELEERTHVSNVVLHKFLSGKSVHAATLRKILAWLDGGRPAIVDDFDKLLERLFEDWEPDAVAATRARLWRQVATELRRAGKSVPEWLRQLSDTAPAARSASRARRAAKREKEPRSRDAR